jgi:hypothetical protein
MTKDEAQILVKRKISDLNCLNPKGEFSNRLERALDLSKNVLDQAKRDLGNSLFRRVMPSGTDTIKKKAPGGQHAGIPNMPALTGEKEGCDEEKILHRVLFSLENTMPK